MRSGWQAASIVGFLVVLALLAWDRWEGDATTRPFEYDEWLALEYYAWPGITAEGSMRSLRRTDDFYDLDRPTLRNFALGSYRSLGEWKEPNNHVPHSFLVNCSLAVFGTSEASARAPAFLAALLASVLMFLFLQYCCGWRVAAPFVAIWLFCLPYVVQYSLEARGYSLMLCLQIAFLMSAQQAWRRPESILWGTVMTAIAIASAMNILSLAVDWLLPAYIALFLFPNGWPRRRTIDDADLEAEVLRHHTSLWRRNLIVQMLAGAFVGGLFVIDRLPFIISSARQYGQRFHSISEMFSLIVDASRYLFAGPAAVAIALLGIVGCVLMVRRREHRTLAVIAICTLIVSLLHFVGIQRLPYARTCAYTLPLACIGTAYAIEACWNASSKRLARGGVACGLGFISIAAVYASLMFTFPNYQFLRSLDAVETQSRSRATYCMLPANKEYWFSKSLPDHWLTALDHPTADQSIQRLVLWCGSDDPTEIETSLGTPANVPHGAAAPIGPYELRSFSVTQQQFERIEGNPLEESELAIVVWYPDLNRLGISCHDIDERIEATDVPTLKRLRRVAAKVDFYGAVNAYEFIVTDKTAWTRLQPLLHELRKEFGGNPLVLISSQPAERTNAGDS
ncbi:Uncharacterized protein SCF082_LOCUS3237 [Durusdinium trenchii]|uniref:Glycosyltransferase RgtA/B/C/D-like domain-containing protein n=1 Tax=Durusdinium trenchii TaxID=1381693 RepID=A0ABP0HRI4_9DINO